MVYGLETNYSYIQTWGRGKKAHTNSRPRNWNRWSFFQKSSPRSNQLSFKGWVVRKLRFLLIFCWVWKDAKWTHDESPKPCRATEGQATCDLSIPYTPPNTWRNDRGPWFGHHLSHPPNVAKELLLQPSSHICSSFTKHKVIIQPYLDGGHRTILGQEARRSGCQWITLPINTSRRCLCN